MKKLLMGVAGTMMVLCANAGIYGTVPYTDRNCHEHCRPDLHLWFFGFHLSDRPGLKKNYDSSVPD